MTKNFYIIFFLLFTSFCFGQVTTSPDKITLIGNPSEEIITFKFDLTNSNNDEVKLYWKLEKGENFPDAWVTQVCDLELCYGDNIDQINIELPNTIAAGDTKDFKIYLFPNESEGSADLTFRIYTDTGFTNEILTLITDDIQISNTTSSEDIWDGEMKIFPNPTQDFFRISNDRNVKKIKLYSIPSKEIMELDHFRGQAHNIESLYPGIYIVRLFDKNNSPLKAMRIQKR